MIDQWLKEVKEKANPEDLGMILVHNGLVRATSKQGRPVRGMSLSFDQEKLNSIIPVFKKRAGITEIKVWLNSGDLKVGDTIMLVLVAGRFRTDVLPVFQELLSLIKNEIVAEKEIQ